jgi:hypothetical protein
MRWKNPVTHHRDDTTTFIRAYFAEPGRRVLIIAAAGFDPRSAQVTADISQVASDCRGIFIREERPKPHPTLIQRAEANVLTLQQAVPDSDIVFVEIFDRDDSAVVGAKRLTRALDPLLEKGESPTDIVLDVSALSIGISFPLVKFIDGRCGGANSKINVHVFAAEDVELDTGIVPTHADQAMYIPGFSEGARLDVNAATTRLWIPQLVANRQTALRRIHDFVAAEETCPILPYPAKRLRRADELLEAFLSELTDAWGVDPRNYLYASEREPLDLYRILLKLDDARKRVYQRHGGSMIILSPVGSKILALGAMLAALERDFPVAYLESVSYELKAIGPPQPVSPWPVVHVWLSGAAYA